MTEQFINCPKCGEQILLTAAITQQVELGLRRDFERLGDARRHVYRRPAVGDADLAIPRSIARAGAKETPFQR